MGYGSFHTYAHTHKACGVFLSLHATTGKEDTVCKEIKSRT